MTDAQLDNFLKLSELAIRNSFNKSPSWCSVKAERMRCGDGHCETEFEVIFKMDGDWKTYLVQATSLVEFLDKIAALNEKPVEDEIHLTGRRVLVERIKEVVA